MTAERRVTTQDVVLRALRKDLLTGQLGPGDQIVQESLADRYGVSRVPLREALKTLESEGQVVYYPHRGYFVAELSVDDLLEDRKSTRLNSSHEDLSRMPSSA